MLVNIGKEKIIIEKMYLNKQSKKFKVSMKVVFSFHHLEIAERGRESEVIAGTWLQCVH